MHLGELKTKPTQHSVKLLLETGCSLTFCFKNRTWAGRWSSKKSSFVLQCGLDSYSVNWRENHIRSTDTDAKGEARCFCLKKLGMDYSGTLIRAWNDFLRRFQNPVHHIDIALVGKYVELPDTYISSMNLSNMQVRQTIAEWMCIIFIRRNWW